MFLISDFMCVLKREPASPLPVLRGVPCELLCGFVYERGGLHQELMRRWEG